MNKPLLIALDTIVIIALVALAIVYFTHPANQLPYWLPGYSETETKIHLKHGLAALILAIGAGLYGYFQTGPKLPADSRKQ